MQVREDMRWWSWLVKKASHLDRGFYIRLEDDIEGARKNSLVEQRRRPAG
jgi:hypothetical protein